MEIFALRRCAKAIACGIVALCACLIAPAASAATFTVNSPADVPDSTPGDGVCETATGNGVCTLRAAVMEADALAGADTITLQPNVTYLLTRAGSGVENGDLNITDSVTINGAGPTSTIVDGNDAVLSISVFSVAACLGGGVCDALHPANVVTLSGLGIQHGKSITGGAIYNAGTLTVDHCMLSNNHASKYGGAIYNNGGTLAINASTISENTLDPSPGGGGGIFNGGTATIRNSVIWGNSAVTGGGINNSFGPLVVIDSTISGNNANGYGGGIYSAASTGLYSSTIAENLANADESGSETGGGVYVASASFSFVNTILAGNLVVIPTIPYPTLDFDDCGGTITSQGNNIVEYANPASCNLAGSALSVDPNLGALQDNGGPTWTHALLGNSPAIDAGNTGGCTDDLGAPLSTDQRGSPRPNGRYCDIGAFEASNTIFRNGFQP